MAIICNATSFLKTKYQFLVWKGPVTSIRLNILIKEDYISLMPLQGVVVFYTHR